MYSLVLLTAMAGSAPGHYYFHAEPCCCHWPIYPLGGDVVFFWNGPASLTEAEEKEWQDYLDALDYPDRDDVQYYWSRADKDGKRKLLNQVRLLRTNKDEYDRKKREEEQKIKMLEEEDKKRKEEDRKKKKDDDKKGEPGKKADGKKGDKKDDDKKDDM